MKKLFVLFASICLAQTPGTITVGVTVTATAGNVTCAISNPAIPAFHTECKVDGNVVLTQDVTPAVGVTNAAVGTFKEGTNIITWLVQQPTAGKLTWQVVANGTQQSGTF